MKIFSREKHICHFCQSQNKVSKYKYFAKEIGICNQCIQGSKKIERLVERFNK
jgi:ribosomal protein L37AE/L43A